VCGRLVASSDPARVAAFFVVDERRDAAPVVASWNVTPTQPVRAVVEHEGRRLLVAFRWGLIPRWADTPSIGARLINARAETVAVRRAYRQAFTRLRCLVPADGFYEWLPGLDGRKQPYHVARRDGAPPRPGGAVGDVARPGGAVR
jgi:putative SOS response-associated peptidase YedK